MRSLSKIRSQKPASSSSSSFSNYRENRITRTRSMDERSWFDARGHSRVSSRNLALSKTKNPPACTSGWVTPVPPDLTNIHGDKGDANEDPNRTAPPEQARRPRAARPPPEAPPRSAPHKPAEPRAPARAAHKPPAAARNKPAREPQSPAPGCQWKTEHPHAPSKRPTPPFPIPPKPKSSFS